MDGETIDLVVPWVDSSDPAWRREKNRHVQQERATAVDASETRYRDWDVVRYLFRSIDRFMPWVNKVFFVTWGHLPVWMDSGCGKLRIVRHEEFIPPEYLPTFCSHAIELNIHRIPGLSDRFVYFNDDLLVMRELKPSDFFLHGLPRDYAILNPIGSEVRNSVQDIALSDVEIVNAHFKKNPVIRKSPAKWFSPRYGAQLFRTFCLLPWPHFTGFLGKHQGNAFLKASFSEVWEKEFSVLDATCRHKFRTRRDVNQWLVRYWQLASGHFVPAKPYGKLFNLGNDNSLLLRELASSREKTICINDNGAEPIANFEKTKAELLSALDAKLPEKSPFEN